MNERIKKMVAKAGSTSYNDDNEELPVMLVGKQVEQFAELIVKECMEVCKSRVGNSDYNTGRMHCVSDLKEYFGVE